MLLMYSFGSPWMQDFVAPSFNREFGALENTANIPVAIMVIYALKCFFICQDKWTKVIFGIATFISLFIFLEEIDYGLHFYDFFYHIPTDKQAIIRNIHSQDQDLLRRSKTFMYLFIMVVFTLVPLLGENKFPPFLRSFICSPKIIYTAISLELISIFSQYFIYTLGYDGNRSLDGNVSEFGEGIIYYMIMLYLIELFKKQKLTPHIQQ
jgi:hypothetical protein